MTNREDHRASGLREEYGFDLCEFLSEGGDCQDCKANPEGDPIYFHSDGGYDCREGSYRCENCVDAFISECINDLKSHLRGSGACLRWAQEDARKAKGKARRARRDARIKARGTYRSGHRKEIYRAKVEQLLRRKCPGMTFYA